MSSHDCRLSVSLNLKEGITEDDVRDALAPFLDEHGLDFDAECQSDGDTAGITLDLESGSLEVSLDVSGYGGYVNDDCDALVVSLAALIDGPDFFLFEDFDTGDSEAACIPYFIGATPLEQAKSRLSYGIQELETWLSPVVHPTVLESIKQQLLDAPLLAQAK